MGRLFPTSQVLPLLIPVPPGRQGPLIPTPITSLRQALTTTHPSSLGRGSCIEAKWGKDKGHVGTVRCPRSQELLVPEHCQLAIFREELMERSSFSLSHLG